MIHKTVQISNVCYEVPHGLQQVPRSWARADLHDAARIHADHDADPPERGVLLLIIADVPQRGTPGVGGVQP